MKRATLAEFDEEELDWRETAERQIENLESYWHCPTPEELDELSTDEAIDTVEGAVSENVQLAQNIEGDVHSWGEMAIARIRARAKANRKAAKAKAA
jgi:hypothetical protein